MTDQNEMEARRLHALMQLKLVDTPASESFDRVTRMAARLFDLPIAAVSLTDRDRQWFKSRIGVDHSEIPRDLAPCAEVAECRRCLVIPDLIADHRYSESQLALSGIRFYAGAPLITREGHGLGAMCVLGPEPRQITSDEQNALEDLAAMVMSQIELQHAFGRVDPVSGLPNRNQWLEDLEDEIRDHAGGLRSAVIVEMMETSRLNEVLRVLGPGALDDLIRRTTQALARVLGAECKVYQVAPIHFAWLIRHRTEADRTDTLADMPGKVGSFLNSIALPVLANPVVGVAPFELGHASGEDILRIAHGAAQDARTSDRRVRVYCETMDHHHQRRLQLLSDLPQALADGGQLSLVYQPRLDLRTGSCAGVEALLRWQHPTLGAITPGEYIPMVEQTEFARPLTDWVIRTAIQQSLDWKAVGLALPISVNVSVSNLEEEEFGNRLVAAMNDAGLAADRIDLEVVETARVREGSKAGDQLRRLRECGIKISIDDFGTGYSSLAYLQHLPANTVKIDRSFVSDLSTNDRSHALVRSMVELARGLGFRVVAEGVENSSTLATLARIGCDEAQGYWISRPLGPEAIVGWLASLSVREVTGEAA